jgi:cellulose synthase/poly-beta-1,6-N-acetylglucosamine synthase-like glycosyltransferase
VGYGLLLTFLVKFKKSKNLPLLATLPEVTLIIPCYNEADYLVEKIDNIQKLNYPAALLRVIFISDGSNDQTGALLQAYPQYIHLHQAERAGKSAAMTRAMTHVETPYVIFCDANTELNKDCIQEIVKHYADETVGGVSGEKRVRMSQLDDASATEGFYWKYESYIKSLDSQFYTVVGAAGELFSLRTTCFTPFEKGIINDDLVQSMQIVLKGLKVAYEPNAFAFENSSATLRDERNRKIRMVAGAWQAMFKIPQAFNPLHNWKATFQFISHRVLRWTLCPLALLILLPLGVYLQLHLGGIYTILSSLQIIFYGLAILGMFTAKRPTKIKFIFVPYYFLFMNYCSVAGFIRFLKGGQSSNWEKVKRK